jgi:hypothetical protein
MKRRSRLLFWLGPLPGLLAALRFGWVLVTAGDAWDGVEGRGMGWLIVTFAGFVVLFSLLPLFGLWGWDRAPRWGVALRVSCFAPSWLWVCALLLRGF